MADIEYLKKNHLYEAYQRLKQINEYVINPNKTNEAEDPANTPQGDPNMPPAPPQGAPQDGNMPPAGPDPNAAPQDNMPPADPNAMPAPDPNAQPQVGPDPSMPPATMAPEPGADVPADAPAAEGEEPMGDEEPEGDDEVIDVEDLTQSQEASEYKLDGVDQKLTTLLTVVDKLTQAIENNDAKVEDLKKEIAERNPSHQEHLNIRSQAGKPFDVNPTEYWKQEQKNNPNYNIITDNDVSPNEEEKVYTITTDDLKDVTDTTSDIAKSFDNIPKSLKDYFE